MLIGLQRTHCKRTHCKVRDGELLEMQSQNSLGEGSFLLIGLQRNHCKGTHCKVRDGELLRRSRNGVFKKSFSIESPDYKAVKTPGMRCTVVPVSRSRILVAVVVPNFSLVCLQLLRRPSGRPSATKRARLLVVISLQSDLPQRRHPSPRSFTLVGPLHIIPVTGS